MSPLTWNQGEVEVIATVGGSVLLMLLIIVIWLLIKLSNEKHEHVEQDTKKHEHMCWHGFLKKLQEHYKQKHEEEELRIRLKACGSYSVIPVSQTSRIQPKFVECEDYDLEMPLCKAVSISTMNDSPPLKTRSRTLCASLGLLSDTDGQHSHYSFPPDDK